MNILLTLKLGDYMEMAVDASHLSSENKVFPLDNKIYYFGPLIKSSCRRKLKKIRPNIGPYSLLKGSDDHHKLTDLAGLFDSVELPVLAE